VLLAVGKLRVDVLRQHDHLARDVLLRVLVTGKIAFDVTESQSTPSASRKFRMMARISVGEPSTPSRFLGGSGGLACLRGGLLSAERNN